MPTFNWRHDGPVWKFDGGIGRAYGKDNIRSTDQGQFLSVVSRRAGVTIGFDQIIDTRPGVITVIDNVTRLPVDPLRLDSYALTTVTDNPQRATDVNFSSFLNARRNFLWRVPVTLRGGVDFRQTTRDSRSGVYSWTYRGSTVPGSAAPFLDKVIAERAGPYGLGKLQFADYKGTFDYFKANPSEFTLDENANYRARVSASKHAVEGISATYLRGDVALFERRLRDVPREALSMGMGTILRARRIVLLATGAGKAGTVKRMVCGAISPALPASFLQLHAAVEVWVDGAAGAALSASAT